MNKAIFRALGDNMSPFAPNKKCIPLAIWGAGALAAAAGVGSSIANTSAQKSANETNLEMNRMTNETNRRIAQETNAMQQAQFNTNLKWLQEQFYKQRQFELENYDMQSPENVARRLRNAGINPAMALGSFGSQMPSSSVGSVGAPSQSTFQTGYSEAGHVDPIQYDFSGITEPIGHAVNAYYQNELINEQTEGMKVSNDIARATAAVQVSKQIQELRNMQVQYDKTLSDSHLSDEQRDYIRKQSDMLNKQIDVFTSQMDALSKQPQYQNDLLVEQKNSVKWDVRLKEIDAALKPALAYSQIRLNSSQLALVREQVGLVANEAKESAARGEKVSAETIGVRLQNSLTNMIHTEKAFQYDKLYGKDGSRVLREFKGFSNYVGDVIFGSLKGLFK